MVIMLTALASSFAQEAPTKTAEQRAEGIVKNMTREMSLTAEQTAKVSAIQIGIIKKADDIRAKAAESGNKKNMQKDVKAANDAGEAEIKALLTPEQLVKYDAWQEKRREAMKAKQGGGGNN